MAKEDRHKTSGRRGFGTRGPAQEDRQKRTGRRGVAEEVRQKRYWQKRVPADEDRQKRTGRRGQAEEVLAEEVLSRIEQNRRTEQKKRPIFI